MKRSQLFTKPWQFGLKSLFAVILAVCVVTAYVTVKNRNDNYVTALENIEQAVGHVTFIGPNNDSTFSSWFQVFGRPVRRPLEVLIQHQRDLPYVRQIGPVLGLSFGKAEALTDDSVRQISNLRELRQLHLPPATITDQQMQTLSCLSKLEDLNLRKSSVEIAGSKSFRQFRCIRKLNLSENPITDEAMQSVASCRELHDLNVSNTKITDDGVTYLGSCIHLERL
jgi:hypothetical protein